MWNGTRSIAPVASTASAYIPFLRLLYATSRSSPLLPAAYRGSHTLSSAGAVVLHLKRRPRSPTHPRFADRSFCVLSIPLPCSMCCRCTRNSEVNYMDQNTRIYRFCLQHKQPPVVLEQAARCEVISDAETACFCQFPRTQRAQPDVQSDPSSTLDADGSLGPSTEAVEGRTLRGVVSRDVLPSTCWRLLLQLWLLTILGDSSLKSVRCATFVDLPTPLCCADCFIFQHGDCDGTPRYGTRDGPLSFCQAHKRVGLFTTRDGELYVATRDGSGESLRCPHA